MDQNTKRLLTNYAAAYFYLGTAYRARGELRKAIEAFEFGRAFRGDQVLPFIHQLVSLYEEIGEKEKAMEYLRQTSVELNQEAIWYRLGISHLRENDIEEAESCFYKAIYANPEDPAYGYAGLIETYYTQQDTKKVREIFKLCANNPKMTGKILGIFKANQKDELAESLLKTWLTYHPYDTVARDLLKEM
jgi:tetratricopeptide (TPR) repeat protein